MSDKIATWEAERIPYYEEIQKVARKLARCYTCIIVFALVPFLFGFVLDRCGCKAASVVLCGIAFVVVLIGCIYWAAVVGNAKCCNCGGGVLIWSRNFRKVLDGCFPLCRNCRKILGVDFIRPQPGSGDTSPMNHGQACVDI